jgi:hypothetical protein
VDAKIIDSLLQTAVQIVNFIQVLPVNSRLLKILCNDRGSYYENLNFYTEIFCPSLGKVQMIGFRLTIKLHFFSVPERAISLATIAQLFLRRISWHSPTIFSTS